ncbi:MAG: DHH family phosphoesterase [Candidatus Baldrarchaeia archaeon]
MNAQKVSRERYDKLFRKLSQVCELVRERGNEGCIVVFHDDADGLASAAILLSCLEKQGFHVERKICLEKFFPEVVRKLEAEYKRKVIFYLDIGAPHVRMISQYNEGKNLVIILDHHDTMDYEDPLVLNLDPELMGISGEKEVSGATITYFFSKFLVKEMLESAHLAVIGSAEIPGVMRGLNRMALNDAVSTGRVKVSGHKTTERYLIQMRGRSYAHTELSKKLTVLGSVGYYQGGPELGIRACIEDFPQEILKKANELELKRKKANELLITRLKSGGLRIFGEVQYFDSNDVFKNMGTKVIGTFCSYLSYKRWIHKDKYIIGFMLLKPEIPGFGNLNREYLKVSARVPPHLKERIERGEKPPLSYLIAEACRKVGGFGDGHAVAASGVIPPEFKRKFLEELNSLIKGWRHKNTLLA